MTDRTHYSTHAIITYLVHTENCRTQLNKKEEWVKIQHKTIRFWEKISYSAQKSSHSSSTNLSIDSDSLTTPLSFNLFRLAQSHKRTKLFCQVNNALAVKELP